jgi:DNA-binding HxlR family transcriptional regulator
MAQVIDALSSRWGVLTIEAIDQGYTRFNELRRGITGISHKVLINTLRAMQRNGFVVGPTVDPGRADYLLTDLGRELVDLIGQLRSWSEDRRPAIARAHVRFDRRHGRRR